MSSCASSSISNSLSLPATMASSQRSVNNTSSARHNICVRERERGRGRERERGREGEGEREREREREEGRGRGKEGERGINTQKNV